MKTRYLAAAISITAAMSLVGACSVLHPAPKSSTTVTQPAQAKPTLANVAPSKPAKPAPTKPGTPTNPSKPAIPTPAKPSTPNATPPKATKIPPTDDSKLGKGVRIGFFGYSAANSFSNGVYDGIKAAATKFGATVTLIDSQYDGKLQAVQIKDATMSKRYDVMIVQPVDNQVVQEPLASAIAQGITVVVESGTAGTDWKTIEPQVAGAISIINPVVKNGEALADLGLQACKSLGVKTCKVGYLEGKRALPLEKVRTGTVLENLEHGGARVIGAIEAGYTADGGKAAFKQLLKKAPDIHVVIGSSQAIAGAQQAAGAKSKVLFIGNGSSRQAIKAVEDGNWFATYALDVYNNGFTAAELGLRKRAGQDVPVAVDEASLTTFNAMGTRQNLAGASFRPTYND
jgi:ribose transport system substrate-binding protein